MQHPRGPVAGEPQPAWVAGVVAADRLHARLLPDVLPRKPRVSRSQLCPGACRRSPAPTPRHRAPATPAAVPDRARGRPGGRSAPPAASCGAGSLAGLDRVVLVLRAESLVLCRGAERFQLRKADDFQLRRSCRAAARVLRVGAHRQRRADVPRAHPLAAVQVGDRARHAQHPVLSARAQQATLLVLLQQLLGPLSSRTWRCSMRTSMCAFTVTPSSFKRAAWRSRAASTCSRAFSELVSGAVLEAESASRSPAWPPDRCGRAAGRSACGGAAPCRFRCICTFPMAPRSRTGRGWWRPPA